MASLVLQFRKGSVSLVLQFMHKNSNIFDKKILFELTKLN